MLNFFVSSNAEGELTLTTGGYVALAILVFALIVAASVIADKNRHFTPKKLAFSAIAIALATITSMIKLLDLPFGGSITLFSMLFITLIGYWYGPTAGLMSGFAYGILQFLLGPYIVSLPQVLIDYPLAFGALGLSGFFCNAKQGLTVGYLTGVLGRFFFAVVSGVVFFYMYAPENMSPLAYSAAYNGIYLAVEAALTLILILALQKSGVLARITAVARDESGAVAPRTES